MSEAIDNTAEIAEVLVDPGKHNVAVVNDSQGVTKV